MRDVGIREHRRLPPGGGNGQSAIGNGAGPSGSVGEFLSVASVPRWAGPSRAGPSVPIADCRLPIAAVHAALAEAEEAERADRQRADDGEGGGGPEVATRQLRFRGQAVRLRRVHQQEEGVEAVDLVRVAVALDAVEVGARLAARAQLLDALLGA